MHRAASVGILLAMASGQIAALACPMGSAGVVESRAHHAADVDALAGAEATHAPRHGPHAAAASSSGVGEQHGDREHSEDGCRILMTCGAVAVASVHPVPRAVAAEGLDRIPAFVTGLQSRLFEAHAPPPRRI